MFFRSWSENLHQEAGEAIYQTLYSNLIAEYPGQAVAIEPESGAYFVGSDLIAALNAARKAYQGKLFYCAFLLSPAERTSEKQKVELVVGGQGIGHISGQGWPRFPLHIRGERAEARLETGIDLGFAGSLTIPVEVAVQLGLELVGRQTTGQTSNGGKIHNSLFLGTVIVAGYQQQIDISLTETPQVLVGRGFFAHYELELDCPLSSLRRRERTTPANVPDLSGVRSLSPLTNPCPACDASMLPDSQFCTQCGHALTLFTPETNHRYEDLSEMS